MPTRFIQRRAALAPDDISKPNANAIFIDSDDNQLKFTTGTSGTTTVDAVTETQTQTLTNKTVDAPVLSGSVTGTYTLAGTPTLTSPVINNATGVSALIAAGGTLAMTAATHSGRTIALDTAAGSVVTLPASTGGGAIYRFLVTLTATSNSHVIQVANATDEFRGFVVQDASEATAPNIWWAADNDDTVTLNRTTTGLAAQGEYFEVVDGTSGVFFIRGYSQANGIEATPFSNAVS
mgnify:CR=1 FL=1